MSGSTLRRTVLSLVVVALLLPLASAYAAPAGRNDSPAIRMPDWSRTLVQTFGSFLDLFRLAADADSWPPGQKPGSDTTAQGREGNGFDPHGRP